jgi:phytoene dehydrogenase-like protein
VREIVVQDGRATGVVLASGDTLTGAAVISGADARHTFLRLIDPVHLDPDLVQKVRNIRMHGTVAKVNVALSGLPAFTALGPLAPADRARHLAGRVHIGPGIDYLERAFDASKYGGFSPQPVLDVTFPSAIDPSLAPPGAHVMSVHVQFAPYTLRGTTWDAQRDALAHTVMQTLDPYAPGIDRLVVARQVITPDDLERTYGLTGGHLYQGELALDQLFTMRPLLGWAQYRMPIAGLYLCGPATHPGVGVTGLSGYNAAREVSRDLKA